jgi:hypothetical protein
MQPSVCTYTSDLLIVSLMPFSRLYLLIISLDRMAYVTVIAATVVASAAAARATSVPSICTTASSRGTGSLPT